MQKSDINKAFGDIERKFEPLERELMNMREFNQMLVCSRQPVAEL